MPLKLRIESELDERSATAAATRAEKIYSESARNMSRELSEGLTKGAREGGRAIEQMADQARASYKRVGDATDELRQQERQLKEMREEGARGVEVQAERVRAARKRERLAIKEAAAAYDEYEAAAKRAGEAGEQAISGGMQGAAAGALASGKDAADNFVGGLASSSALLRLGTAAGPIGIALAGVATLGVLAGQQLAQGISEGMATLQMRDIFQGRMGVDEASMAQFAGAAGAAYANNWGASVSDNLSAAQAALRSGIIDPAATDAEIQAVIEQLQGLTTITDASAQELSRSITTMMRTGMADSVSEASDVIVSGFQNGLDISGDWLDTLNEYSTQFRKLGLDSSQVLTLLSQGLEGGARDTDKVADSLKEFSIRAVDGSKTTREGFEALGFSADEMGKRFAAGGDSAAAALGSTLQALKSIQDPLQQALIWQRLFGTQFEDMGDAINQFDLSAVGAEFRNLEGTADRSTKTATDNFKSDWEAAQRSVEQGFADLSTAVAEWFTGLPFIEDLPGMIRQAADDIRGIPRQGAAGPIDGAVPGTAMTPLGILSGSGTGGWFGDGITPAPAATGGQPSAPLQGPLGPLGEILLPGTGPSTTRQAPGAPAAPVPGARTPILTDTEAAAQSAAGGGGGSASLPAAPSLPLQYTPTAGLPAAAANAQTRLDEVRHQVAEKQARVNQLEQSNLATEEDIQKARNELTKAERDQQQAEQALHESRMSAYGRQTEEIGQMSSQMGEIGAALDSDLGISDGLAGIADNLVRFVASLAMAPMVGSLSAIANANPGEGSGLMGMLAANGAFGSQYVSTGVSAASMGPAMLQSSYGGGSAAGIDAALLANVPAGRYSQDPSRDLLRGLSDCSSSVGDLVNMLDGLPTGPASGERLTTHNAASWLTSRGFVPGAGGPGDFRVGYDSGHMEATLPGGTNFNYGSDAAAARGGRGGQGASAFPNQYYRPVGVSAPATTPGLYSPANTSPGLTSPGAPLPPLGGGPMGGGSLLPGAGMPQSFGPGASLGGQSYPSQGGEGGIGLGGMAMDGIMAATSGLDMMAPGAGAAAKIGIQVANRTAKYAGQVAGIGIGGLLDTITPAGDNPKASIGNSWLGKIAGGVAGASAALPNMAGGKQPPGPMDGPGGQGGQPGQGGNTVTQNLTLNNNHATEDMVGNQMVREAGAMFDTPGGG